MTTSFSSLPIVDLSILSEGTHNENDLKALSEKLFDVFSTVGFAYLINTPLTFAHDEVFDLAKDFFTMDEAEKLGVGKKTFVSANRNTYRGYFPTQPGQQDNLKEGFEIGLAAAPYQSRLSHQQKFNLAEPNVWPSESALPNGRARLESLHGEMQALSATLLSLMAVALNKPAGYFATYLGDSLSTLRLLHYPPQPDVRPQDTYDPGLCCTQHTDSGILTLLHQDQTGGLEVLNADAQWVPAPYVPGSIVVNIGDLMARVSGGRFVATMHRVRATNGGVDRIDGMGRFSVPFFFEPGESCVVRSVDGDDSIVYGEWVRKKMGTWVEYQDLPETEIVESAVVSRAVEVF